MNGRFQIAVHIMTLLYAAGNDLLSSDYIAGSVNINPVLIRKELSNLIKQGLVSSKEGKSGGYFLAKPAEQVSLADILNAVKTDPVLGKARNKPNPNCDIGREIDGQLSNLEREIEQLIFDKLSKQSLIKFYKQFN
jgi:Rrf2 family protein